jgi:hypothetical protein
MIIYILSNEGIIPEISPLVPFVRIHNLPQDIVAHDGFANARRLENVRTANGIGVSFSDACL